MCRPGSEPWVGKIPWRRAWQPTPVFLPGESHGQRSLVSYSPWGRKELDTTEWLNGYHRGDRASSPHPQISNLRPSAKLLLLRKATESRVLGIRIWTSQRPLLCQPPALNQECAWQVLGPICVRNTEGASMAGTGLESVEDLPLGLATHSRDFGAR